MILINGEPTNTLSASDRGLHYGDGLFETIEVIHGQPVFLAQHLARLKSGCQVLKIPFPSVNLLMNEIRQISRNAEHGVVKLMLTRGSGGRGYRPPEAVHVTRLVALHPFPDYPESYARLGVSTRFCDTRLGVNPVLAGIKHNNRLEQVLARAEWQDQFQEGLMLNVNEHVIEGTMSNLFVVKDQLIFTPELDLSGVKGTIRAIILDIARAKNVSIKEASLTRDFVLDADELFVTNAVIGIWPITLLENIAYPVGDWTQRIMTYLADFKENDISS